MWVAVMQALGPLAAAFAWEAETAEPGTPLQVVGIQSSIPTAETPTSTILIA